MQTLSPMTRLDGKIEHTRNAWHITSAIGGLADPTDAPTTRFAQVDAEELHDQVDQVSPPLVARTSFNEDNDSDSDGNDDDDDDDDKRRDNYLMVGDNKDMLISEDFEELDVSPESRRARFQPQVIPQEPQDPENPRRLKTPLKNLKIPMIPCRLKMAIVAPNALDKLQTDMLQLTLLVALPLA
jgi:hypothetical protein